MFLDKSQFDLNAPAEPEHPEQTGPKRFLEIIQAEFLNLVKLNLLLLLCCLPVITPPPPPVPRPRQIRPVGHG